MPLPTYVQSFIFDMSKAKVGLVSLSITWGYICECLTY